MKWTFLLGLENAKNFFNASNEELNFEEYVFFFVIKLIESIKNYIIFSGVIQFVGHIFGKDMYSLDDDWHAIANKVCVDH